MKLFCLGVIAGNQTIKTLVIRYLFTKTISVNNGKIILSFIDINRVNTHVSSFRHDLEPEGP